MNNTNDICPVTGKHCDDEMCGPSAECNLSDNTLEPAQSSQKELWAEYMKYRDTVGTEFAQSQFAISKR